MLTEDETAFIRNVHFISLFVRGLVAGWPARAAAYVGVVWVAVFVAFFFVAMAVKCGFLHQPLPG